MAGLAETDSGDEQLEGGLTSGTVVASRAVNGVRWSAISQVSRQGVSLVSAAVLARLLQPRDYGLMNMAVIVTGFANIFRDLGTSSYLVQRSRLTPRMLSSVFWLNLGVGFILALAVALLAPLAAAFFREPRVGSLLQVLALTFPLSGLSMIPSALLQREIRFQRLAKAETASAVVGAAAAIIMAWQGFGVWSLVYALYAQMGAMALFLGLVVSWRPAFSFAWEEILHAGRYSLNLTGFSVVNYWARSADNLLVGRFLGATELGLYSMAYRLFQYPLQAVSGLVTRVLFPVMSRLQDDPRALRQSYLRTITCIATVTFPIYLGIFATARPFIQTLLSDRWLPIVAPLMVFMIVGANQSLATATGCIYTAKGRTDLMFRVGLVNSGLYVLGICIGLRWGMLGVASSYAVADVVVTLIDYHYALPLVGLGPVKIAQAASRPLACASVMALALWVTAPTVLGALGKVPGFLLLATFGLALYLGVSWRANRLGVTEVLSVARRRG